MTNLLPPDIQFGDRIALACFVVAWLGYGSLIQMLHGTPNITSRMVSIRREWMHAMLGRDNRITDASLIGNTIHSNTFFASTTMIALAALLGMLGRFDATYATVAELSFAAKTSRTFVEFKVLLLILVFAHTFLKLTWALRQLNYCVALFGSAPLAPTPLQRETMADRLSAVLSLAIGSFNAGIRGYYFALAAFAWFLGPVAMLLVTAGMLAMLLWRQFGSATADAIGLSHAAYPGRDAGPQAAPRSGLGDGYAG